MKRKRWIGSVLILAVLVTASCGKGQDTGNQRMEVIEVTESKGQDGTVLEGLESSEEKNSGPGMVISRDSDSKESEIESEGTREDIRKNTGSNSVNTTKSNSGNNKSGSPQKDTGDHVITGSAENVESSVKNSGKSSAESGAKDDDITNSDNPPSAHISCVWDEGSIVKEAACNAEGQKVFTCKVCGASRTESIARSSHHYVTETMEPTCTEAGKNKTYCSDCGAVQSETQGAAAAGHSMTTQWFGEPPTCTRGGYQTVLCSKCGWVDADACGDVPPLEHDTVGTEIQHGNCRDYTVIEYTCRRCNEQVGVDRHKEPDEHEWVWKEDSVWDDETLGFVTIKVECCARCNARP